jgi:hypothetical protein
MGEAASYKLQAARSTIQGSCRQAKLGSLRQEKENRLVPPAMSKKEL